jgi:hypothetical protein
MNRDRYGTATACSWDLLHPRLTHRTCWLDHDGDLPVIEGTVIRLTVEHLPGDRDPKPVWLWWSGTGAEAADVDSASRSPSRHRRWRSAPSPAPRRWRSLAR